MIPVTRRQIDNTSKKDASPRDSRDRDIDLEPLTFLIIPRASASASRSSPVPAPLAVPLARIADIASNAGEHRPPLSPPNRRTTADALTIACPGEKWDNVHSIFLCSALRRALARDLEDGPRLCQASHAPRTFAARQRVSEIQIGGAC